MVNEFSNAIVVWLLRRLSGTIAATEAFAFGVRDGNQADRFPLLAHIRDDKSSAETLRAAREAFIALAKPCIDSGKNGAIELIPTDGVDWEGRDPQFCLVVLIPALDDPKAVLGFIGRFRDKYAALAGLARVQIVSQPRD